LDILGTGKIGTQIAYKPYMEKRVCRKCQSQRIVKAGFKKVSDGKIQRYKCQSCGYYFTGRERYHRLPPEKVALIHKMYEEKGGVDILPTPKGGGFWF
jgi:transposase-like protein